jgi:hypothetical protein
MQRRAIGSYDVGRVKGVGLDDTIEGSLKR